jgi:hypothetical protein
MGTITIQGYVRECTCNHCGRQLKLGVSTPERGVVGADCFVKLIARNTKRYRTGKPSADWVKQLSIIASKGPEYAGRVHGLYGAWATFDLAGAKP